VVAFERSMSVGWASKWRQAAFFGALTVLGLFPLDSFSLKFISLGCISFISILYIFKPMHSDSIVYLVIIVFLVFISVTTMSCTMRYTVYSVIV